MGSFARAAISVATRARSKTLISNPLNPKSVSSLFSSPSTRTASRVLSVLGSVESLMPFHSATANARLRSSLALDTSYWSSLSQGFATPL